MEIRQIVRDIKQGNIAPVYVFYGTEQYIVDETVRLIEACVLDEASRDFNYSAYDLRETPVQTVLQDAETFPFMGEKRVIRASYALFLTGSKLPSGAPEHDMDALGAYIENPPDYSVLILEVAQDKLDERKKVVKALKKNSIMVECAPLKEAALADWVVRQAKRYHVGMDAAAADLLIAMSGTHLRQLDKEIEKLAAYVGEDGEITEPIVEKLATRELEHDIFRLIDKIARLQIEEAMRMYYDLQQLNTGSSETKGEGEPLKILTLLARQFRILLQIKTLQPRGYSQQQMASLLGIHPYVAKLASEQAHAFNERTLKRIIHKLAEEDIRIKTGQIDKVLALELFILGLKDSMHTP
ncbi:DNA polymerase III subunit delta [Aneurinibacillus aneurinilyticus]|uniref:DNA polymerase III subunit delta n=1 Tax=Aneurinibacillus aneurinilyticus ATCC 12856 TaxID=649747 RepID=U1YAY6_ANEAE|nr:DNA polymerase III subunit delta [Aneurinibacillus aneurinilyticus]ERI07971.1 DNA polymerase III, delta subunit [Aneurinibacillus aneurinilyticus ATCC 12856]MED0705392.1 DNA polymerase III subunit delta [Aneurinibacillus aneurinilyticus]MED0724989.1 DNA polymerase III subunit delta [Aneurinibacillus aneurinilyticus]MED0730989.1 DNA polymerase III subunit delta [Aneurinibacillus aneurinilyticus]MED0742676.1 DNA polymerase III subunit delta [Aneurinibacillus aneurinilyticus]